MQSAIRLPVLAFALTLTSCVGVSAAADWPLSGRLALAGGFSLLTALLASRYVSRQLAAAVERFQLSEKAGMLVGGPSAGPARVEEVAALISALNGATVAQIASEENSNEALTEMLRMWSRTFEGRDTLSASHSARVADLAGQLAQAMGRPFVEVEQIRLGALIHDIGKAGIPDSLLHKPGPLSEAEQEIVKRHTVIGRKMLEGVRAFVPLLPMVELHHENFDGSGYPWGLRGEEIPLSARIVRVADAFDAMTSNRHYHAAMTQEQALEVLRRGRGAEFDPNAVEAFQYALQKAAAAQRPVPDQLASLHEGVSRTPTPVRRGPGRAAVVSIQGAKARPGSADQQETQEEPVVSGAPFKP